jgi:hypothetical protein
MNVSKMKLAGYGDQAYIFHKALKTAPFLGWIWGRIDYGADEWPRW